MKINLLNFNILRNNMQTININISVINVNLKFFRNLL